MLYARRKNLAYMPNILYLAVPLIVFSGKINPCNGELPIPTGAVVREMPGWIKSPIEI